MLAQFTVTVWDLDRIIAMVKTATEVEAMEWRAQLKKQHPQAFILIEEN